MMKIPEKIYEKMKCNTCKNHITSSPVFQTETGENICEKCNSDQSQSQKSSKSKRRNIFFENIGQLFLYPCKNGECKEDLKWSQTKIHENFCEFNKTECFVENCKWEGLVKNIYGHFKQKHKKLIAIMNEKIEIGGGSQDLVLKAYNFIFVVHIVTNVFDDIKIQISLLVPSDLYLNFGYRIETTTPKARYQLECNSLFFGAVNSYFDKTFRENCITIENDKYFPEIMIDIVHVETKCLNCEKVTKKLCLLEDCCSNPKFKSLNKPVKILRRCMSSSMGCKYIDVPENLNKHHVLLCNYFRGGSCSPCNFFVAKTGKSMFQHEIEVHHKKIYYNKIIINPSMQIMDLNHHDQLITKSGIFLVKWSIGFMKGPFALKPSLMIELISNIPTSEEKNIRFTVKFVLGARYKIQPNTKHLLKKFEKQTFEENMIRRKCEDLGSWFDEWFIEIPFSIDHVENMRVDCSLEIKQM